MYYGYLETFKILEGYYTHTQTHAHAHTHTHTHTHIHTYGKNVPAIYDNDKKNIEIFVLPSRLSN